MTLSQARAIRGETGFTMYDGGFRDVIGLDPRLRHVIDVDAHEGPVYAADEDALYFTSLPGGRAAVIKRLALDGTRFSLEPERVTELPAPVTAPNGMTMGHDGALLVCDQGSHERPARISRVERETGRATTVLDSWRGLPLNSPNDVVVHQDGGVWFTDPSYGHLQGLRPPPRVGDYVYRIDPSTGTASVVADSFDKPNGVAFSPDQSVLYVTDSGANQGPGSYHVDRRHHVIAFDVRDGRHLVNQRLVAVITPGFPDGLKVDRHGRLYVSSFSGVQVLSSDGDLLGQINLPGAVNFTFGGADQNLLFITTDTAIWAAVLDTQGM
ncbi:MAG: SMP-30/gluconolactonase/LRE family protein [Rhodoglobus sp.]